MSFTFADRVQETTSATGTGTFQLAGASAGFQSFVSGIGSANSCYYIASDGAGWETGIGTVTSGTPNTLSRTTVLESSNAGAAVNFASTPTVQNGATAQLYDSLIGSSSGELLISQANAAPEFASFLVADTAHSRLGIGTSAPTSPLTINATSQPLLTGNGFGVQLQGDNSVGATRISVDGIDSVTRFTGNRVQGSVTAPTPLTAGNTIVTLWASGYDGASNPAGVFANTTNGSTTVSGIASTSQVSVGMPVSGAGIPSGATVSTVNPTSLVISAAATSTNHQTLLTFLYPANLTSSSPVITGLPQTGGLLPYSPIADSNFPANTYIVSVDSASQVTASANATATLSSHPIQFLSSPSVRSNAGEVYIAALDAWSGSDHSSFIGMQTNAVGAVTQGDIFRFQTGVLTLGQPQAGTPQPQTIQMTNPQSPPNFMMASPNVAGSNLYVIGSGSTGSAIGGNIVFQTVQAGASGNSLNPPATSVVIDAPTQSVTATGHLASTPKTVSALGAATSGSRDFVTDSTATLAAGLGLTVAGGGANKVPVYADGTNWLIG